jgi:hypothetical protein
LLSGLSRRAHIIGVSVSEISSESTSDTLTVTANSRNSNPTYPLIRKRGIKTAMSESVIDTMVKPI